MSKIKKLKVKINETEFGTPISLGADAINIDMQDGTNAEEAINNKVSQNFDNVNSGEANKINADTVSGEGLDSLYSKFIQIEVPAAVGTNSNGLYYSEVSFPGITSNYAIMGIQMTQETATDADKEAAALTWDYLETSSGLISFYGTNNWTTSFSIIGILIMNGGN